MRTIAAALLVLPLAAQAPTTHFPPPPAPNSNPVTVEKALLGMALFWEEQLSSNNTVACGSCHGFARGGTEARMLPAVHAGADGVIGTADDVRGSRGVPARDAAGLPVPSAFGYGPQVTPRKAPSVVNAAYLDRLFYDGRAATGSFTDPVTGQVLAQGPVALENLVLGPPLNPVEMGHPGRTWAEVVQKIAAAPPLVLADRLPSRLQFFVGGRSYPELFQIAFGTPEVSAGRIAFAIASYLRTLVADQTRFDYYTSGRMVNSQPVSMTAEELRGRDLFENPQGNAAACVQCHGDISLRSHRGGPSPLLTTSYGMTPSGNFHNVGIRPIAEDPGSGNITLQPLDQGRFKVPLLRNVALHARFGHGGQLSSLAEVIDFYDRGGDFHVNQAPEIQPRNLSSSDKAALVAFLHTLTDPRLVAGFEPFDSPRLGSERPGLLPTVFGIGSPGTGGALPQLVAQDPVFRGGTATLAVHGVLAGAPAFLMWDLATIAEGFDVLGPRIYMGFVQFTLVGMGLTQAAPDGSGHAAVRFAVPAAQQLADLQVYAQWLVLDPLAAGGAAASPAVEMTLR